MNTRKKLKIQVGTKELVVAVYDPDQSRWVYADAIGPAYVALAAKLGYTDFEEAGPSTIRVEDA